jgi:hypothetical protein
MVDTRGLLAPTQDEIDSLIRDTGSLSDTGFLMRASERHMGDSNAIPHQTNPLMRRICRFVELVVLCSRGVSRPAPLAPRRAT